MKLFAVLVHLELPNQATNFNAVLIIKIRVSDTREIIMNIIMIAKMYIVLVRI